MSFDRSLERDLAARLARVGRARDLHLDEVRGVVLVDVWDFDEDSDTYVEPGTVVVEVYMTRSGDPQSAVSKAYQYAPSELLVAVMVRRAKWRHRLRAWFRIRRGVGKASAHAALEALKAGDGLG